MSMFRENIREGIRYMVLHAFALRIISSSILILMGTSMLY